MTVFRGVIVATAFPLVTWAAGRVLIALAVRTPPGPAGARLYLADRVDRITAVLAYENELLMSFAADLPTEVAPEPGWSGGWRTAPRSKPIAALTVPSC